MEDRFDLDLSLKLRTNASELLRGLERVVEGGVVVLDVPGEQVIAASAPFLQMVGRNRDDVVGLSLSELGLVLDDEHDRMLGSILKQGVAIGYRIPLRPSTSGRGELLVDLRATVVPGIDGSEYIVLLVHDPTSIERQALYLSLDRLGSKILAESQLVDPWKTATRLVKTISQVMNWEVGFLWRHDPERGVLKLAYKYTREDEILLALERSSREQEFRPGQAWLGSIWQGGPTVVAAEVMQMRLPDRRRHALRAGMRSMVCALIPSEGVSPGALEFFASRDVIVDAELVQVLHDITGHLGGLMHGRNAVDRHLTKASASEHDFDQARADYTTLMEHRIRNPLAIIKGASETLLAQASFTNSSTRELLLAITEAADRLKRLSPVPGELHLEEHKLHPEPSIKEPS